MNWKEEVERYCRVQSFGPPCTVEEIEAVERHLSARFPSPLRDLYLAFDGFRGPTNARFLWSLKEVTDQNKFIRGESWAPKWIQSVIFFGDNGVGGTIGVQWGVDTRRPNEAFGWSLDSGDEQDFIGTILDAWEREQRDYDSVAGPSK